MIRQVKKSVIAALLTTLAVSVIAVQPAAAATTVIVDPGIRSLPFGGWGTSLAWSANYTGNWTGKDTLADLLYSTTNTDANPSTMFNIARYNIGGGNDPAYVSSMRVGAAVPGYKATSASAYDWTADANQRWWLQAAKSRVPSADFKADAISYSAPYWMTKSGQSTGNTDPSQDNLLNGYEAQFADYLTEVVKHFRDSWGITFRTLNPMNEANSNYWAAGGKQEGMKVSAGAKQVALINATQSALQTKSLTGTTISGLDETSIAMSHSSLDSLDATAAGAITQFNTHTYSGGDRQGLYQKAVGNGRRLQMSEVTTSSGTHDHSSVSAYLGLASAISTDLKDLAPQEWVYWQALESEAESLAGNGNWGLIHFASDGTQNYWITKKFHVMRQYSNFIRPGYKIIANDDAKTITALDPATGKVSIIVYNDTASAASYTFDLNKFGTVTGSVQAYRTSSTENRATLSTIALSGKTFTTSLPANSVSTFIVQTTGGTSNLVQNPNFETVAGQNIPGWITWGGDYKGTNIDADYTQAGGMSGGSYEAVHWKATAYNVYTSQDISLPNGTYTLKANVRSSGGQSQARMVAKNYGGAELSVNMPATSTYTTVTIPSVPVSDGSVQIGFYSVANGGNWIAFDNVSLTPVNLGLNKTIWGSSQWDANYAPAKANDGDSAGTRWNSASGTSAGEWLQIDFGSSTTFNTVVLKEFDTRITNFKISYWNGSAWVDSATGTTIGASKTVTFAPVTGTSVRLLINSATNTPSIYEFEVYNQ
ncbi:discoidin domain-containing protein [Paenibacillus lignilyticus]|uniref:Discoidin domain-containing protein n=1 Tax=Paenibacillus lignilyticus TaxID=1172615 RepID=A0ABS5C9N2_9BACL|nr:glycoside hydrolase [Paenibacillus lignilyticus]MBP3962708.1 discoidin domain-containing protein [Paenibacillus lignilyticus]